MQIRSKLKEQLENKIKNDARISTNEMATKYEKTILPAMQKIFVDMNEVVNHLNALEHCLVFNNYSNKKPNFGEMNQTNYSIKTHKYGGIKDTEKVDQITLRYTCSCKAPITYVIEGKSLIEQEINSLLELGLIFEWEHCNPTSSFTAARFRIDKNIPVTFDFKVNPNDDFILLTIKNYVDFSLIHLKINPERINDLFLDDFVHVILREKTIQKFSAEHKIRMPSVFR